MAIQSTETVICPLVSGDCVAQRCLFWRDTRGDRAEHSCNLLIAVESIADKALSSGGKKEP